MTFFVLLNTKEDILQSIGNQTAAGLVAIDFHRICPHISERLPETVWLPTFYKIEFYNIYKKPAIK